jgi:mannose-6-phosphate isomerase-like protein (cupin superfamily)
MENNITERSWGYYRVIEELGPNFKVKELVVYPGQKLSMQRHKYRSEFWMVTEGIAKIYTMHNDNVGQEHIVLRGNSHWPKFTNATISLNEWHQLSNETDAPLKVLEIQYGEKCEEEDIERKPLL